MSLLDTDLFHSTEQKTSVQSTDKLDADSEHSDLLWYGNIFSFFLHVSHDFSGSVIAVSVYQKAPVNYFLKEYRPVYSNYIYIYIIYIVFKIIIILGREIFARFKKLLM